MSVVRRIYIRLARPLRAHLFIVVLRVLMLRQKASPTETQIRSDCSRVVDEALELVPMRWSSSEQTLDGSAPASFRRQRAGQLTR